MTVKSWNTSTRKMQAALEDAGERTRALSRLLGWASEEAKLLGHGAEAQALRDLSQQIAVKSVG